MIKYVPTTFGLMLEFPKPDNCDLVIVCVDRHQHIPVTLCLPHQVYLERMRELLAKYPDARGITLIPCRSWDKVMLTSKELQGVLHERQEVDRSGVEGGTQEADAERGTPSLPVDGE